MQKSAGAEVDLSLCMQQTAVMRHALAPSLCTNPEFSAVSITNRSLALIIDSLEIEVLLHDYTRAPINIIINKSINESINQSINQSINE